MSLSQTTSHYSWFKNTGIKLKTSDGKLIEVVDFLHKQDATVLKDWAKHFRNHYISDKDLPDAAKAMGKSNSEFLKQIKFPSKPHIRSGDFSEILVADYIEFVLQYIVPRTRYDAKLNKNTSPFGVDILGFKSFSNKVSIKDELITCEVKADLASKDPTRLSKAVEGSKNDFSDLTRLPEALNAMRQRLKENGKLDLVKLVERYQDKTSRPYKNISGAALVCSNNCWDPSFVNTTIADHPNKNLYLLVIKGDALMDLVNSIYELSYATA